MTEQTLIVDDDEELEPCATCGNEYDPSELNDCPYCGDVVCDDCLAEHEDDEGEHDSEDESEQEV